MSCCTMVRGHDGVKPLWVQELVHAQPDRALEGTRTPRAFVYVTILFHVSGSAQNRMLRIAHLGRVQGIADWADSFGTPETDWLTAVTNSLPRRHLALANDGESVQFRAQFTDGVQERLSSSFPECAAATRFDQGVDALVARWGGEAEANCDHEIRPRPDSSENADAPFIEIVLRPHVEGFILTRVGFETNANIDFDPEYRHLVYPVLGPLPMYARLNQQSTTWDETIRADYQQRLGDLRRYQEAIQYEILLAGDPTSYRYDARRVDPKKDDRGFPLVVRHPAAPPIGHVYPFIPEDLDFEISLQAECKEEIAPLQASEGASADVEAFNRHHASLMAHLI